MLKAFKTLLFLFSLLISAQVFAQKNTPAKSDSTKKKNTNIFSAPDPARAYNPRIATYRSAILPGWGQYTNKKIWKIPVVYAALGTTTYIFFRNTKQYREARDAYANAIDGNSANDSLIPQPYYSLINQPDRIRTFRNQVRQNVDYTVLFFILFWGLNVVDATVDAHLKTFDVSDDLSLQIKPGYSQLANTNGISIVLNIGKHRSK
ncbi:MAG: hypothetical protein JNM14_14240 [Ferruginibacter sp.]|nr:hypothetical protein [Ferruginibacter sp.]